MSEVLSDHNMIQQETETALICYFKAHLVHEQTTDFKNAACNSTASSAVSG